MYSFKSAPAHVVSLYTRFDSISWLFLIGLEHLKVARALKGREGNEQGAVAVDGELSHVCQRCHWVLHVTVAEQESAEVALERFDAAVYIERLQLVEAQAEENDRQLQQ